MSEQLYLKKNEDKTQIDAGLKNKFEELKGKEVGKATTKIVNIKIQVGCGCGGNYEKYNVEVPIDKNVDDGDYFDDFEPWMTNINDGWINT